MNKKKVLIISYSHLRSDPRIQRQIIALQKDFDVETAGFSDCGEPSIPFYNIYSHPSFSLERKLKRAFQLFTRQFEKYYWDDGKKKLVKLLAEKAYNVIVANDIYTLPLALSISKQKSKIYFDAHEYAPKEFEDNWKWNLLNKGIISYLCKNYIPKADYFTTVSDGIADEYAKFVGVKPDILTNATDFKQLEPLTVSDSHIKLILHTAAIPSRKLECMIQMMNETDNRYSLDLLLVGDNIYIEKLKKLASKNNRINFPPPVNVEQIPQFLNNYDIGVFILPPVNFNYLHALPNKLFEFVQARLAVAVTPNPEMAKIVRKYKLGIVSEDYSPEAMAKALNKLSSDEIFQFKRNSHFQAHSLSAEENINKINKIVHSIISGTH